MEINIIHTIINVADGGVTTLSFTSGLVKHDLPEFFMYGSKSDISQFVLNNMADAFSGGKLIIDEPTKQYGTMNFIIVKNVTLEQSIGRFGVTDKEILPKEILEVVWADFNDKFPWDEGFNEDNRRYQLELHKS